MSFNFEQNQGNYRQNKEKKSEGLRKAEFLSDYAFNFSNVPGERYEAVLNRGLVFFREDENNPLGIEVVKKIKQDLIECCKIQDKEEFKEKFLIAMLPILQLEKDNPKQFELLAQENALEFHNFTKINNLLSYGKSESEIHIHVAPAVSMSQIEKLNNLRNGLSKLADIVENDKEIEIVTATSALVAEHPQIVEKLMGFTVDGPISEEIREKIYKYDSRDISTAHIKREDFLKKWKK